MKQEFFRLHTVHNALGKTRIIGAFLYRRFFYRTRSISGSADTMCREIVQACWNGAFFQMSFGHFSQFWMRDFGIVAPSLIALGERKKVIATLRWALAQYRSAGRVATTIFPDGHCVDLPEQCVDSLPWLVLSLYAADAQSLVEEFRPFLAKAIQQYAATTIDPRSGLVHAHKSYAELRDAVVYQSSMYANTMLLALVHCATNLGLTTPELDAVAPSAVVIKKFWNGRYFNADIQTSAFSAEANLFPFWLGIVSDETKLESVLATIKEKGLASPLPLAFTDSPKAFRYRRFARLLAPNYQGTTLWTWLGMIYLQLLERAKKPDHTVFRAQFAAMIEHHGTLPELLHPDGSWYTTPWYRADEGLLWAALFLKDARLTW